MVEILLRHSGPILSCEIPGEWVGEGGRMIITRAAVSEQSEANVSHPRGNS